MLRLRGLLSYRTNRLSSLFSPSATSSTLFKTPILRPNLSPFSHRTQINFKLQPRPSLAVLSSSALSVRTHLSWSPPIVLATWSGVTAPRRQLSQQSLGGGGGGGVPPGELLKLALLGGTAIALFGYLLYLSSGLIMWLLVAYAFIKVTSRISRWIADRINGGSQFPSSSSYHPPRSSQNFQSQRRQGPAYQERPYQEAGYEEPHRNTHRTPKAGGMGGFSRRDGINLAEQLLPSLLKGLKKGKGGGAGLLVDIMAKAAPFVFRVVKEQAAVTERLYTQAVDRVKSSATAAQHLGCAGYEIQCAPAHGVQSQSVNSQGSTVIVFNVMGSSSATITAVFSTPDEILMELWLQTRTGQRVDLMKDSGGSGGGSFVDAEDYKVKN